jgi:hypothetical protein
MGGKTQLIQGYASILNKIILEKAFLGIFGTG